MTSTLGGVQKVVAQSTPLTCLGSGGFCGASGGSNGAGNITLNPVVSVPAGVPPQVIAVGDVNWIQSAASLIVFQGDTPKGDNYLAGVVSAIPNPTAGSCASGTAVSFVVVGVGVAIY